MGRLCLSRKRGERIQVGENVFISWTETRQDKVKILVEAPDDVPIDREEVRQAKYHEHKHHPGEVTSYTSEVPAAAQNGR